MRKIFDRTPAEAGVILRSLKAVATAEGTLPFTPLHRATLEALCAHVLHVRLDLDAIGVTLPDDLERSIVDREVRANLVHVAMTIPFVEPEREAERLAVMHRMARRFEIGERAVDDAARAARVHYLRMALATTRGTGDVLSGSGFSRTLVLYLEGLVQRDGDAALLARAHGFARHDGQTVGRALMEYWRDNAFELPGTVGAVQPQVFFRHDVLHVLAGYDASPLGELALAGFQTGLGVPDGADFTALLLMQLQIAVQLDPTGTTWRDHFDARIYAAALDRGARCTTNVAAETWDPWSVVDRPLEEVRTSLGIPRDDVPVRAASDLWSGGPGAPVRRTGQPTRRAHA